MINYTYGSHLYILVRRRSLWRIVGLHSPGLVVPALVMASVRVVVRACVTMYVAQYFVRGDQIAILCY